MRREIVARREAGRIAAADRYRIDVVAAGVGVAAEQLIAVGHGEINPRTGLVVVVPADECLAVDRWRDVAERVHRQDVARDRVDRLRWNPVVGERNAAGRRYLEENNLDDDLVSWGEFRKAQGLQNDYVDLTYSGRMFAGLTIIEKFAEGTRFVARLGGSDREVDEKLDWNSKRYGDFLQPNADEQREVDEIVQEEFENLVRKFLA